MPDADDRIRGIALTGKAGETLERIFRATGIKPPPRIFDSAEGMVTPLTRDEQADAVDALAHARKAYCSE